MQDAVVSTTGVGAAYAIIRSAIVVGDLPPDSRMSQVKLAARLNLSRTPVREALRMLQRDGLVTTAPGRMVRIAAVSADDLDELYALRINIETTTARMTVPLLSDGALAEMQSCLDTMEALETMDSFDGWVAADRRLHQIIIEPAGGRPQLLAQQLSEHAQRYRALYLSQPASWMSARREHNAILAACRAKAADRVAELLADHYAQGALSVAAMIDPTYEPRWIRSAVRNALRGVERGPNPRDGRLGQRRPGPLAESVE